MKLGEQRVIIVPRIWFQNARYGPEILERLKLFASGEVVYQPIDGPLLGIGYPLSNSRTHWTNAELRGLCFSKPSQCFRPRSRVGQAELGQSRNGNIVTLVKRIAISLDRSWV